MQDNQMEAPILDYTLALAGFNVKNPITNAVINSLVGNSKSTENPFTSEIKCEICNCSMSSSIVYGLHLAGAKHQKKLKAKQVLDELKKNSDLASEGVIVPDLPEAKSYDCQLCSISVNSPQQLELHITGFRHKRKLNKGNPADGECPNKKKKSQEYDKAFRCDLCSVVLNSQIQIDEHTSSRRHFNKLKHLKNACSTNSKDFPTKCCTKNGNKSNIVHEKPKVTVCECFAKVHMLQFGGLLFPPPPSSS